MNGNNRSSRGMDGSPGQGGCMSQNRGGGGRGRMDGPRAGGPVGNCICPQCGHNEAHERGVPCLRKKCPKCGTAMVRQ